ncbi:MAG: alpha/beta hydrolase [Oleiphilaceae bacterium]|nr:alpha/beta hydrolase [Oleiphilaceae bacterium]
MKYSLQSWQAMGKPVSLLGQDVFVVDSGGDGPCLLLLHGYPTAGWDFAELWPALCERFRVIVPDLLGLGFSAKPCPHNYSIFEQADLVSAVLDHCQVTSCHMLAHDYGDTVAQELLARDNERSLKRYLSAALLNGGLFPETHRPRPMQKLMAGPLGPLLVHLTNRRKLLGTFCSVFGRDTQPSAETLEAVWQLVNHNRGLRCLPPLLGYIRERRLHRDRWVNALAETRAPLALINGSADPVSGAHMVVRFRELVGDQHFTYEMPGIGHYPHMEAPEETLSAYLSFVQPLLEGQTPAASPTGPLATPADTEEAGEVL